MNEIIANHTSIPEKDRTTLSKENNQIDSLVVQILKKLSNIFKYYLSKYF